MKLAVEVTTCTAERTGVGYYTEHLVDALIATARPGDEVALIGNRALAPAAAAEVGRPAAHRRRAAALPLDAAGRRPHARGSRRRLRALPQLPGAAGRPLPLRQRGPRSGAHPDAAVLQRAQARAHPAAPAGGRARRGGRRHRLGGLAPRRDRPARRSRGPDRDAPRRAPPRLPPARRGGDRARARPLRHCAPLPAHRGDAGATQEPPAPAAGVRRLRARTGHAGRRARPGDRRRQGVARPRAARRAGAPPHLRTRPPARATSPRRTWSRSTAARWRWPTRRTSRGSGCRSSRRWPAAPPSWRPTSRRCARSAAAPPSWCRPATTSRWPPSWRSWPRTRRRGPRRGRGAWRARRPSPGRPRPSGSGRWPTRRARGSRGRAHAPPRAPGAAPPEGADARDWAIAATVTYADLFDAAVTVDDLARSCLGAQLDPAEVARRAAAPPLAGLVTLDGDGHLTLRGREALVARRADGIRRTAELLARHQPVIAALAALPFVRSLALSGGTAHRNARGGDDIDLFVVTAAGRIYTTYTLLFLASRLTHTRGVVCPNYLVDENNLEIAYHHDLFTAHQALSLVPIAGLETFDRFVAANRDWVRRFYPSYEPSAPRCGDRPGRPAAAGRTGLRAGRRAIERALATAWRFHLGRRAARARGSTSSSRAESSSCTSPITAGGCWRGSRRVSTSCARAGGPRARRRPQSPRRSVEVRGSCGRPPRRRRRTPARRGGRRRRARVFPRADSPFFEPKLAVLLAVGALASRSGRSPRHAPAGTPGHAAAGALVSSWSLGAARDRPRAARRALRLDELVRTMPCWGWRWARDSPRGTDRRRRAAARRGDSAPAPAWWRCSGSASTFASCRCRSRPSACPGSTFGNRNVAAEAVAMAIPFGLGLSRRRSTAPPAPPVCPAGPVALALLLRARLPGGGARAGGLAGWRAGDRRSSSRSGVRASRRGDRGPARDGALALLAAASPAAGPRTTPTTPSGSRRPRRSFTTPSIRLPRSRARVSASGAGRWRSTARILSPASAWETSPSRFPRYAEPNATADSVLSPVAVPRRAHNDLLERLAESGRPALAALLALYLALGAAAIRRVRRRAGTAVPTTPRATRPAPAAWPRSLGAA